MSLRVEVGVERKCDGVMQIDINNKCHLFIGVLLFREPNDPLVTLSDVIEAHEELEAEAEALLGGANANVCTYAEVIF